MSKEKNKMVGILKKIGLVLVIIFVLLVVLYFGNGLYWNLALKERALDRNTIYLGVRELDSLGRCEPKLVYSWEIYGTRLPTKLKTDDCIVKDTDPLVDVEYSFNWGSGENKKTISALNFGFPPHPFFITRPLFRRELVICFDNFNQPLLLEEEYTKSSWFGISGVNYEVQQFSSEQRVKWERYVDDSIEQGNFPQKAYILKGNHCEGLAYRKIIKEYDVEFFHDYQLESQHRYEILN